MAYQRGDTEVIIDSQLAENPELGAQACQQAQNGRHHQEPGQDVDGRRPGVDQRRVHGERSDNDVVVKSRR